MIKKIVIAVIALLLITLGADAAKKLSTAQIRKYKTEIVKRQKEVARLQKKLKVTRSAKLKQQVQTAIKDQQNRIKVVKNIIYPKPKPEKIVKGRITFPPSFEVSPVEEILTAEAVEKPFTRKIGFRNEFGVVTGIFAGMTSIMGETRFPLSRVIGPAVPAIRLSLGLAQGSDTSRRFVPVNLDLIFNYPPGWFSGVENYLGAGLNYLAYTSGRVSGTVGGQVFYGVQSEGFGGAVFGELGYAIVRTGFSPSSKGSTVLVGYRRLLGL